MSEKERSWTSKALSGLGNLGKKVATETTKLYGAASDQLYNDITGVSSYFRESAKEADSTGGKITNKVIEEAYKSYVMGLDPISAGEYVADKLGMMKTDQLEDRTDPEAYLTLGMKEYKSAEEQEEALPTWSSSSTKWDLDETTVDGEKVPEFVEKNYMEDTISGDKDLDGGLELFATATARMCGFMAGFSTNAATFFIPAAITGSGAFASNLNRTSDISYKKKGSVIPGL